MIEANLDHATQEPALLCPGVVVHYDLPRPGQPRLALKLLAGGEAPGDQLHAAAAPGIPGMPVFTL